MKLMGWSSSEMRKRYEHIQDEALRREIDRMAAYRQQKAMPIASTGGGRAQVIQFLRGGPVRVV